MLTILVKNHFEQLSYYLSTPYKVEIKLKKKEIIRRDNKKPEWRTENFVGANQFQICLLHTEQFACSDTALIRKCTGAIAIFLLESVKPWIQQL